MKTVRVRIAVVVDEKGGYNAVGWKGSDGFVWSDKELVKTAQDAFQSEGNEAVHFIEADVALPEPQTIEGKVVP